MRTNFPWFTHNIVAKLLLHSGSAFAKKERLGGSNDEECDDEDHTLDGDTFAVVENPLYAENEADIAACFKEDLEESEDEVSYGCELTTHYMQCCRIIMLLIASDCSKQMVT